MCERRLSKRSNEQKKIKAFDKKSNALNSEVQKTHRQQTLHFLSSPLSLLKKWTKKSVKRFTVRVETLQFRWYLWVCVCVCVRARIHVKCLNRGNFGNEHENSIVRKKRKYVLSTIEVKECEMSDEKSENKRCA